MANLGNLFFSIGLKDNTNEDWEKIIKRVEQRSAKMGISVDAKNLHAQISEALQNKKYTIDLSLAIKDNELEAAISRAYSRVANIGGVTTQTRPSRQDQLIRAESYAKSQSALERSRNALAQLREARLKDAEATRRQKSENDLLGKSMGNNERLIKGLRNEFLSFYSIYTLQSFLGSLISIGGEFQKQHIALKAMLGDTAKADAIFSKIKELAVESPFNFKELTGYSKQLAAFSIPYEELYETTKRLADISAGLGVDMGRIILAYGQVRSAAFLRGQEVRQFTEAGIPLLDKLAEKFTQLEGRVVSVGEVFDKISKREVSFQMVKDVLWDLTNEGGQFYQMQEVLTESLSGKLDKLKDSYQIMLSEIANANNGLIGGSLDMLTSLTDKWRELLNILFSLIAAYGAYKVVMFAANAAKSIAIAREIGFTNALNLNTLATYANEKAHNKLAMSSLRSLSSLAKFKTTLSGIGTTGWIGILLSGLAAIGTYLYSSYQNANKLKNEFNEIASKGRSSADSEAREYGVLVEQLNNAAKNSKEYNEIKEKIQSRYGAYLGNIEKEADAYKYLHGRISDVTEALRNKHLEEARQQGMSAITDEFSDLKGEAVRKSISKATDLLGITRDDAKKLIGVIQTDVSNGMATSLVQGYDTAAKYIERKAQEVGLKIKIPKGLKISEGDNPFGVTTLGGATSLVENLKDLYTYTTKEEFAVKELNDALEVTFGNITPVGIKIEKLQKAYEKESNAIPANAISKQRQLLLELLEAKKKVYEEAGQENEVRKIEAEIATASKLKDEWQEIATEKLKAYHLQPNDDEKEIDYVSRLKKEYKSLQDQLETIGVLNPEKLPDLKNRMSGIQSFFSLYNLSLSEKSGEDTIADQWKERIGLIEKAISSYREWEKLEGNEIASKRIKGNTSFASVLPYLNIDNALADPSKIWGKILKDLPAGQKDLVLDVKMKIDKQGQEDLKNEVDKTLKGVKEHIKKTTNQWNLYKTLLSSGVSGDVAMRLSFGGDTPFANIAEQIKSDIAKALEESKTTISMEQLLDMDEKSMNLTFGAELGGTLTKLVKEYKDANDEIYRNTLTSAAKLIAQNRSYEDQIIEIKRKANEDIKNLEAQRSKFGDETTDKAIAQRRVNEQKEIGDVRFEQFKNTDDWEKAFGDLDKLTTATINRMIASFIAFREAQRQNLSVDDIKKLSDIIEKMQGEVTGRNPFERITQGFKNLKAARKSGGDTKSAWTEISDGLKGVEGQINDCVGAAGDLQDMFDSIGNDSLADMMGLLQGIGSGIGSLVGSADSFASGNVLGGITRAVSGITGIISSIANFHDKKLDRAIEQSQIRAQRLKNTYDEIERSLERFLGNGLELTIPEAEKDIENLKRINTEIDSIKSKGKLSIFDLKRLQEYSREVEKLQKRESAYKEGGAYGYQRQLLEEQYAELENQRAAELEKKDIDQSKIADYDAQMAELRDQITYMAQDIADTLYGINLKDWASQLGDSIYDAWKRGEDGAEAFRKKAGEIIGDVMNNILKMQILEPAMKDISDYLFGTDEERAANGGKGGVLGTDFELDDEDMKGLADKLMAVGDSSEKYASMLDRLNSYMEKVYGTSLKDVESSSGGLASDIKSVTEDTANLLASYLNAIRQDASVSREYFRKVVEDLLPKVSNIANAQLKHLKSIDTNTKVNAEAANAILSLLQKNINGTNKFNFR